MSSAMPIAACRPVDDALVPNLPGLPVPFVYPGSVIDLCEACRTEVYIGPKLQEALEAGPVAILCFTCAAAVAAFGRGVNMVNLGNDYRPA